MTIFGLTINPIVLDVLAWLGAVFAVIEVPLIVIGCWILARDRKPPKEKP